MNAIYLNWQMVDKNCSQGIQIFLPVFSILIETRRNLNVGDCQCPMSMHCLFFNCNVSQMHGLRVAT